MKFTCKKDQLLRHTNNALRLVTNRSTLPILQNVYLSISGNTLVIKATDLEQTLESSLEGEGFENGTITVPARLLVEFLQNNTDTLITIENSDLQVKVSSSNHSATLRGISAEDYPTLPTIEYQNTVSLPSSELEGVISRTLFAAANDETRPILTGLLFHFGKNELTVVATDGYRLAKDSLKLDSSLEADYVIPKKALQELQRLLGLGETVNISLSTSQFKAEVGDVVFISRVLEGKFPAYENIIPKTSELEFSCSAAVLLQSLKLASLFSRDSAYSTLLEVKDSQLKITATSPTLGESTNTIQLDKSVGAEFSISVNAHYLIDLLGIVSGDVTLQLLDQKSPIVFKTAAEGSYLYLVMPLRGGS